MVTTQKANEFADRWKLPPVRSRHEVKKSVTDERFKLNRIPGSITAEARETRRREIRQTPFPWPGLATRVEDAGGREEPTSAGEFVCNWVHKLSAFLLCVDLN